MTAFALFDTAIGTCAIAWSAAGICGVLLPERTVERSRAVLADRYGAEAEADPPPAVRTAIERIAGVLDGAPDDLADLVLDGSGLPDFHRRVYEITRSIRPGTTLSYGDVAHRLGQPGAARVVGRALGDNPYPIVVPCHRVVAADGSMHGFSAVGGVATKKRMLQREGALPPEPPTLF
jgi:methylated-DNA-[protein]-cysteine S-methyltransferase